ncbi:hypothetical protein LTS18_008835, partial [Coniosporium uncinatum]
AALRKVREKDQQLRDVRERLRDEQAISAQIVEEKEALKVEVAQLKKYSRRARRSSPRIEENVFVELESRSAVQKASAANPHDVIYLVYEHHAIPSTNKFATTNVLAAFSSLTTANEFTFSYYNRSPNCIETITLERWTQLQADGDEPSPPDQYWDGETKIAPAKRRGLFSIFSSSCPAKEGYEAPNAAPKKRSDGGWNFGGVGEDGGVFTVWVERRVVE